MTKRLVAGLAVAVLFLAGCGDDGDNAEPAASTTTTTETTEAPETTTTTAEESLTADEWVEEADAICAEANEEFDLLGQRDEEPEEILPDLAAIFDAQLDELESLAAPDEIANAVGEALEVLGQQRALIAEVEDAIDDVVDPDEASDAVQDEFDALDAELADLADELGLEVCGVDDPGSDDPEPSDEPFTNGDDAALDALWDDCEGGDGAACDQLSVQRERRAALAYGDDAELDELWDACEAGNGAACDQLSFDSPLDSVYESFGDTCGGLFDEDDVPLSCEDEIGGEPVVPSGSGGSSYGDDPALDALFDDCAGGDMAACDDLFWRSPAGSEYESFGNTCGGIFDEDDVSFSCEEGA